LSGAPGGMSVKYAAGNGVSTSGNSNVLSLSFLAYKTTKMYLENTNANGGYSFYLEFSPNPPSWGNYYISKEKGTIAYDP